MMHRRAAGLKYLSEQNNNKTFTGSEEIISRFQAIHDTQKDRGIRNYSYMAVITSSDRDNLPYGPGKRCVIIAENDPDHYISIRAFLMTMWTQRSTTILVLLYKERAINLVRSLKTLQIGKKEKNVWTVHRRAPL